MMFVFILTVTNITGDDAETSSSGFGTETTGLGLGGKNVVKFEIQQHTMTAPILV